MTQPTPENQKEDEKVKPAEAKAEKAVVTPEARLATASESTHSEVYSSNAVPVAKIEGNAKTDLVKSYEGKKAADFVLTDNPDASAAVVKPADKPSEVKAADKAVDKPSEVKAADKAVDKPSEVEAADKAVNKASDDKSGKTDSGDVITKKPAVATDGPTDFFDAEAKSAQMSKAESTAKVEAQQDFSPPGSEIVKTESQTKLSMTDAVVGDKAAPAVQEKVVADTTPVDTTPANFPPSDTNKIGNGKNNFDFEPPPMAGGSAQVSDTPVAAKTETNQIAEKPVVAAAEPVFDTSNPMRDKAGRVTDTMNSHGEVTHYIYDSKGQISEIQTPKGSIKKNADNTWTGPEGTYDSIIVNQTNADVIGKSKSGEISVFNASGAKTIFKSDDSGWNYNADGQLTSIDRVIGKVTKDANGVPVTESRIQTNKFEYTDGYISKMETPKGAFSLDKDGNIINQYVKDAQGGDCCLPVENTQFAKAKFDATTGAITLENAPDANGKTYKEVYNANGSNEVHKADGSVSIKSWDGRFTSITDAPPSPNSIKYEYANGALSKITTPSGEYTVKDGTIQSADKSISGHAVSISADGRTINFVDGQSNTNALRLDGTRVVNETYGNKMYTFDKDNRMTQINDCTDGSVLTFAYDQNGKLTQLTNKDGTWTRESEIGTSGAATWKNVETGRLWEGSVSTDGGVYKFSNYTADLSKVTKDLNGLPIEVTAAGGQTYKYQRDDQGNIVAMQYASDGVNFKNLQMPDTAIKLDDKSMPTTKAKDGSVTTYDVNGTFTTLDTKGHTIAYSDQAGSVYKFDNKGNLTELNTKDYTLQKGEDNVWSKTTIGADGQPVKDANFNFKGTISVDSDSSTQVWKSADGKTTDIKFANNDYATFVKSDDGKSTQISSSINGKVSEHTYNSSGDITLNAAGQPEIRENRGGKEIVTTIQDGGKWSTVDASSGKLLATSDGNVIYKFDDSGKVKSVLSNNTLLERDANGNWLTYNVDATTKAKTLNDKATVFNGTLDLDTSTFKQTWTTADGKQVSIKNPNGVSEDTVLGANNQVLHRVVTYPDGSKIESNFSDAGVKVNEIQRDASGRITSVSDAQRNTMSISYDANGKITSVVEGGHKVAIPAGSEAKLNANGSVSYSTASSTITLRPDGKSVYNKADGSVTIFDTNNQIKYVVGGRAPSVSVGSNGLDSATNSSTAVKNGADAVGKVTAPSNQNPLQNNVQTAGGDRPAVNAPSKGETGGLTPPPLTGDNHAKPVTGTVDAKPSNGAIDAKPADARPAEKPVETTKAVDNAAVPATGIVAQHPADANKSANQPQVTLDNNQYRNVALSADKANGTVVKTENLTQSAAERQTQQVAQQQQIQQQQAQQQVQQQRAEVVTQQSKEVVVSTPSSSSAVNTGSVNSGVINQSANNVQQAQAIKEVQQTPTVNREVQPTPSIPTPVVREVPVVSTPTVTQTKEVVPSSTPTSANNNNPVVVATPAVVSGREGMAQGPSLQSAQPLSSMARDAVTGGPSGSAQTRDAVSGSAPVPGKDAVAVNTGSAPRDTAPVNTGSAPRDSAPVNTGGAPRDVSPASGTSQATTSRDASSVTPVAKDSAVAVPGKDGGAPRDTAGANATNPANPAVARDTTTGAVVGGTKDAGPANTKDAPGATIGKDGTTSAIRDTNIGASAPGALARDAQGGARGEKVDAAASKAVQQDARPVGESAKNLPQDSTRPTSNAPAAGVGGILGESVKPVQEARGQVGQVVQQGGVVLHRESPSSGSTDTRVVADGKTATPQSATTSGGTIAGSASTGHNQNATTGSNAQNAATTGQIQGGAHTAGPINLPNVQVVQNQGQNQNQSVGHQLPQQSAGGTVLGNNGQVQGNAGTQQNAGQNHAGQSATGNDPHHAAGTVNSSANMPNQLPQQGTAGHTGINLGAGAGSQGGAGNQSQAGHSANGQGQVAQASQGNNVGSALPQQGSAVHASGGAVGQANAGQVANANGPAGSNIAGSTAGHGGTTSSAQQIGNSDPHNANPNANASGNANNQGHSVNATAGQTSTGANSQGHTLPGNQTNQGANAGSTLPQQGSTGHANGGAVGQPNGGQTASVTGSSGSNPTGTVTGHNGNSVQSANNDPNSSSTNNHGHTTAGTNSQGHVAQGNQPNNGNGSGNALPQQSTTGHASGGAVVQGNTGQTANANGQVGSNAAGNTVSHPVATGTTGSTTSSGNSDPNNANAGTSASSPGHNAGAPGGQASTGQGVNSQGPVAQGSQTQTPQGNNAGTLPQQGTVGTGSGGAVGQTNAGQIINANGPTGSNTPVNANGHTNQSAANDPGNTSTGSHGTQSGPIAGQTNAGSTGSTLPQQSVGNGSTNASANAAGHSAGGVAASATGNQGNNTSNTSPQPVGPSASGSKSDPAAGGNAASGGSGSGGGNGAAAGSSGGGHGQGQGQANDPQTGQAPSQNASNAPQSGASQQKQGSTPSSSHADPANNGPASATNTSQSGTNQHDPANAKPIPANNNDPDHNTPVKGGQTTPASTGSIQSGAKTANAAGAGQLSQLGSSAQGPANSGNNGVVMPNAAQAGAIAGGAIAMTGNSKSVSGGNANNATQSGINSNANTHGGTPNIQTSGIANVSGLSGQMPANVVPNNTASGNNVSNSTSSNNNFVPNNSVSSTILSNTNFPNTVQPYTVQPNSQMANGTASANVSASSVNTPIHNQPSVPATVPQVPTAAANGSAIPASSLPPVTAGSTTTTTTVGGAIIPPAQTVVDPQAPVDPTGSTHVAGQVVPATSGNPVSDPNSSNADPYSGSSIAPASAATPAPDPVAYNNDPIFPSQSFIDTQDQPRIDVDTTPSAPSYNVSAEPTHTDQNLLPPDVPRVDINANSGSGIADGIDHQYLISQQGLAQAEERQIQEQQKLQDHRQSVADQDTRYELAQADILKAQQESRDRYEQEQKDQLERQEQARLDRENVRELELQREEERRLAREKEERDRRLADEMASMLLIRQKAEAEARERALKQKQEREYFQEQIRKDNIQEKYVVKQQEDVSQIATIKFHDVRISDLIYELNKTRIDVRWINGKRVYVVKPGTVLILPSPKQAREWLARHDAVNAKLKGNLGLAGQTSVEASEKRENIEKLLGKLDSVEKETGRIYSVRLGDTLRSIAMKHPDLKDVTMWRLLAQKNGLTVDTDSKGAPLAVLIRGTTLNIPSEDEIIAYKVKMGIPLKPSEVSRKNAAAGDPDVAGKKCGGCMRLVSHSANFCPACGFVFASKIQPLDADGYTTFAMPVDDTPTTPFLSGGQDSQSISDTDLADDRTTLNLPGRQSPNPIHSQAESGPISQVNDIVLDSNEIAREMSSMINDLSDSCRLVRAQKTVDGTIMHCQQLEVLIEGQWVPILTYEVGSNASVRHEFTKDGRRKSVKIDLPAVAVDEMVKNELNRNWEEYCRRYLAGRKLSS